MRKVRTSPLNPDLLIPGLAAELIRVQVDVIVTYTTPAAQAAKHATGTTSGMLLRLYVRLSLSDGDARQKRKPTYYESQP
jgi:hypothetical protein